MITVWKYLGTTVMALPRTICGVGQLLGRLIRGFLIEELTAHTRIPCYARKVDLKFLAKRLMKYIIELYPSYSQRYARKISSFTSLRRP